MEKPPPGYPKVPGGDAEAPSDTKPRSADQQPQQPQYPGGYAPGGATTPFPQQGPAAPGGGPYPSPPDAYPSIPPTGAYGINMPPGTSPYQQQPQQQQPAVGVPVLGEQVSYITYHPIWGPDERTRDNRFSICGWLTFALGFFMPIFWLVSVLLPCCLPGLSVRRAATASCIASIVYAIIAIILGPTLRARNP